MKDRRKGITFTIRTRVAAVVVAVNAVSIAMLVAASVFQARTEGFAALEATIEGLERAVSRQEAIASSVTEISRLARRSGYELSVSDIVKDHRRSMCDIRSGLAALRGFRETRSVALPLSLVIAAVAAQCAALLLYLVWFLGRVLAPIRLMSRQIDDVMANRRVVLDDARRPGELRVFYYKFAGLIKLAEAGWDKHEPARSGRQSRKG
ncbi:MAG: hypothetical protein JXA20_05835 [Spirochaetes bacterium]|nr:hypothetical protein [Spirochaetota bacterium]